MRIAFLVLFIPFISSAQHFSKESISRWEQQAKNTKIIRDNWGIPHIYGKSDADAVFGLMYAQCEDDFKRVELNYIEKLGRMAEIKGEEKLYDDLLIRMVIDSTEAIRDFNNAPAWLKKLCNAFADGINYYLYKNPDTKPLLLNRFKPWYPLLWTDGSIDAISTADITKTELRNFYSGEPSITLSKNQEEEIPFGSNGFAFSSKITESGNAILYINPHVSFYFRPEVHMVSEEGLNAYGAVTWGQFFVYQGFNEHCGWMHTSSKIDAADSYIEKISLRNGRLYYEYNNSQKPVREKKIVLHFKAGNIIQTRTIKTLYTHHGPVMAKRNGQFLSMRADNRIMNGLIQCWQRTKAKNLEDFKRTLALNGNISNNTVYADDAGNIAYWHGNRVPARDPKYDWSKPVDGTTSATEWKGLHPINETIQIINPRNGWLQNCNSTPFTAADTNSPKISDYPSYMAPDEENYRGLNAVRVLREHSSYNLEKVIRAGYDPRLTAFETLIPALINSFESHKSLHDSLYSTLAEPLNILRNWDYRVGEKSIATTLAIEWGQRILRAINNTKLPNNTKGGLVEKTGQFLSMVPADSLLLPLLTTLRDLESRFGSWQVAWGEINRFQRISNDIEFKFDDNETSIPVGFVSSTWGMLPSFSSQTFPNTKKRYGIYGNSFICAVEFGKKIKAKSLLAGGESGLPGSKHFFDQGLMYSKGQFRDVLFYKEDILKHAERVYRPGE